MGIRFWPELHDIQLFQADRAGKCRDRVLIVPVTVTVTNSGAMAGEDSVLLFTSAKYQSVAPAVKELKAFTKIQLDPGESKTITMTIQSSRPGDLERRDETSDRADGI